MGFIQSSEKIKAAFISPQKAIQPGQHLCLDHAESRHATQVLRLCAGDGIQVINGSGYFYPCRILTCRPTVEYEVLDALPGHDRDLPALHALVPLIRKRRWEWLVEKLCEAGITVIRPYLSRRTRPLEWTKHMHARSRRIVLSAVKQSRRTTIPCLEHPLPLADVLREVGDCPEKWLLRREAPCRAKDLATQGGDALFLVGPEGGLTDAEEAHIRDVGFRAISVAQTILRSETAALFMTALMRAHGRR